MPIMQEGPGITLGVAQIAELALREKCQICNLRDPKGNTNDTPVLNNVLGPEGEWHIWNRFIMPIML